MKYHDEKQVGKESYWCTIEDADSIDLGGVDFCANAERRKDVELDPNNENLSIVCFENFFPFAKGHTKLIDECRSSRRSRCHITVKKIK